MYIFIDMMLFKVLSIQRGRRGREENKDGKKAETGRDKFDIRRQGHFFEHK